ncbi:MAG: aminopeptidase P family protein [Acidobacteria bacterium]|nr:aminopeptidase P family protein [Acidobacteriota bacterium]
MVLRALALLGAIGGLCAASGVSSGEYQQRRAKVRARLAADEGLMVLYGATEDERGSLRSRFFQESNFYYLTGWQEPGAVLLLSPTDEFFFLPPRSEIRDLYTGRRAGPGDDSPRHVTGFANIQAVSRFEVTLFQQLEKAKKIYGLLNINKTSRLKRLVGQRPVESLAPIVFPLRQVKSPGELALLQRSIDVSIDAHRAAWHRTAAGVFEYQLGATMVNVYSEAGCERSAYPPIIGSGPNSTVLHYNKNDRRMDSGEIVLMDVGGECAMYAADLTRTIPVSGTFTPRQREIYEVVLGAQRAALKALKPGMKLGREGENSLFKIAQEYMNANGKSLRGDPLGKYFAHGLGHHVGLDVHDPGLPDMPLEEGNVVTIEPGIYIPEEGIGIRIEDMVLVTKDGGRVLSDGLPKEPREIEKILHARKK